MLLNYNRDDNIVTLRNKNGVRLDCECLDNFEYNGTEYYIFYPLVIKTNLFR